MDPKESEGYEEMACFLDRMMMMSSAAWLRWVELVTLGKLKCFRKNSTVSAFLVDALVGM